METTAELLPDPAPSDEGPSETPVLNGALGASVVVGFSGTPPVG